MRLNEISLGRSVRYPFFSIFDVVQQKVPGQPGLKVRFKKKQHLPPEVLQSGIYAWSHPDWGYFYVGIASKNNFRERWYKHIQKLLDQCTSAKQMANWQQFSQKFFAAGYGIDDLKNIFYFNYMETLGNQIMPEICLKYYCEKCSLQLKNLKQYDEHLLSKTHLNYIEESVKNTHSKEYICEICDFLQKTLEKLQLQN